ncbi:MAG: hypothetical protein WCG94_00315 [Methanothrix sp.]
MRRILNISIVVTISLILFFNLSMASGYAFGSKVMPNDSDLGRLIKNMPNGTIISFWDIGQNIGSYDAGDVVYLDTPPTGIANTNDIRLTSFGFYRSGTKVMPNHRDINAPLNQMLAEMRFLNLNGSQSYDIYDPVYIVQSIALYQSDSIDTNEGEMDYTRSTDQSGGYTTQASNIANINSSFESEKQEEQPIDTTADDNTHSKENYIQDTAPGTGDGSVLTQADFYEHLSYAGSCMDLPQTSLCLIYSDNYVWPVSDRSIDNAPTVVGFDGNGFPIEVIRCYSADYYHILGTLLVKSVGKQKTLFIQSAPSQLTSITGSSMIRTNDIRLTSVGEMEAGSRVLNFEPDLNKLVALPVLVSFPGKSDDYACLRVFDANGNGLYDSEDSVYLDISFPGYSIFGTVSVNDVRLSGPSSQ